MIEDEIEVYAQACVNLLERGGAMFTRVCVDHVRPGCNWSVAFAGSTTVQWPRLKAEVEKHLADCPHITLDARDLATEARKLALEIQCQHGNFTLGQVGKAGLRDMVADDFEDYYALTEGEQTALEDLVIAEIWGTL